MSRVLLCQLDGEFPNHALMRIAAHHEDRGDEVELRHVGNLAAAECGLFDNFDQAAAPCYNAKFTERRWYTAWDGRDDEEILFRGLRHLVKYGVRPDQIMCYMLIGYWPGETHGDREYRRTRLRDFGVRPYPMVYRKNETDELNGFARWVIRRIDLKWSWEDFKAVDYRPERLGIDRSLPLLEFV